MRLFYHFTEFRIVFGENIDVKVNKYRIEHLR